MVGGLEAVWGWAKDFKFEPGVTPGSQWQVPVFGSALYLAIVFALKQRSGPPIRSQRFELFHNGFLTLLSFSMMCGALGGAWLRFSTEGFYGGVLCPSRTSEHIWDGPLGAVTYIFYLSKFYEFIDTFLLALRKKDTIFLHLWHHASMTVVCWSWFAYPWLDGAWWCCFVNSFIQASLGHKVWYKKYITLAQIIQFMTGAVYSGAFLYFKLTGQTCNGSLGTCLGSNIVNITFLSMFYDFYKKSYTKGKRDKAKSQ